jgi:hypothetical protein
LKKLLFIAIVSLAACTGIFRPEEDDPAVARANDHYLLYSELTDKIPDGLSERDSLTLAQNYISKWIQQEILLQKAKESLSADEQDFAQQLQEYRNSLLLFSLEQKLVEQFLDTSVAEEEIAAYYQENRSQFELKGNIVKFDLVKIVKRSRHLREFRRLLKSASEVDVTNLENYAEKNATDYWFARDWVAMNTLLDEIPLEIDNQALYLRRTNYAEAEDSLYVFLLRINDYRTTDSIPPLEFERDKIRNIILNARKLNLIESKRQEFIEQAFRDAKAEIY